MSENRENEDMLEDFEIDDDDNLDSEFDGADSLMQLYTLLDYSDFIQVLCTYVTSEGEIKGYEAVECRANGRGDKYEELTNWLYANIDIITARQKDALLADLKDHGMSVFNLHQVIPYDDEEEDDDDDADLYGEPVSLKLYKGVH